MKSIRNSGVDLIGNVPWGTHICHLYSTDSDFSKIIVPYFKAGLDNNELCLWVYVNLNLEDIKSILKTSIPDIDKHIEERRLLLMPFNQWYIVDNSFHGMRVNRQWQDLIQYALDHGFEGLRAAGDTSWLDHNHKHTFYMYEKNINNLITDLNFIVVCLYNKSNVSILDIADIMNSHHLTLISEDEETKLVKNTELLIKDQQLEENRQILKQMEEFDKNKSEFFSNISHELRTPINVIFSTVQLINQLDLSDCSELQNSELIKKQSKYLKIIQQNCYRQLRLVNNLIDLSKLDANYKPLKLHICNIVEIIENITLSVVDFVESKGIELVFDTNAEEIFITCDPDQIERILLNLLSNAIKFTDAGGSIRVLITDDADHVIISVKDTGKGIPKDKQEYIFERFHQADKTMDHLGSGIGLSLVKSLVERHNGSISLISELGIGSEFIVKLPHKINQDIQMNSNLKYDHRMSMSNKIEKINIEFSDIYV